jgi:outer membrane protein OmpA-like peptidoglycan-associated protein
MRMNHTAKIVILLILTVAAFVPYTVKAQEVSIRTNLAWDAVSEPNLGLELQTGEHWSVGVDAGLKAWPRWLAWDWDQTDDVHWRNFAVVPEVRYYLKEVFQGFFAGADAIYTHFNVGDVQFPFGLYPDAKNYRLQGSFWGGGLFAGYAWWPWQHWRLELEAGAAMGLAAYDRYDCPHCGTKLGEDRKVGVVPKLAVNIAYNPVSKEKHQARKPSQVVVSARDTITVLTPPVAFVVQLRDVMAPQTQPDRLSNDNDWVIPIEKYRPLDYLTRPGRDSLMYVTFEVDSDVLKPEFGNNAKVLDQLQKAIETIRDAETTDELLVSVVGLASIEGSQERNDTLSVHRAKAVADYLRAKTFVGKKHFEAIGKGEAWDWFKAQLEADPAASQKLLDIVNNEPNADAREQKIKADPKLYKEVKEKYLADQRNSGYIRIYYSNKPDAATEKLNGSVTALLKAKRYHDAVRTVESDPALLARVEADAEAANAYGIALYFTALDNKDEAAEQRAVGLLEKAARMGSDAARHNLKGIETYGPARKEYEAWKEIINENER